MTLYSCLNSFQVSRQRYLKECLKHKVQYKKYRARNGDILRAKERIRGRQKREKLSAAKETIVSEQARFRMKTLAKRKLINVPECQANYCTTPFG